MKIKFANLELTSEWESLREKTYKKIILDIKKYFRKQNKTKQVQEESGLTDATSEAGGGRPEQIHLSRMTRRVSRVFIRETSIPGRGTASAKALR